MLLLLANLFGLDVVTWGYIAAGLGLLSFGREAPLRLLATHGATIAKALPSWLASRAPKVSLRPTPTLDDRDDTAAMLLHLAHHAATAGDAELAKQIFDLSPRFSALKAKQEP